MLENSKDTGEQAENQKIDNYFSRILRDCTSRVYTFLTYKLRYSPNHIIIYEIN